MNNAPAPVIVIQGPTASGKSSLAQHVALQIGAHIISADSMQIYTGMDIGTAKLSGKERKVPHYCIDILPPGAPYSAQLFQDESRAIIQNLQRKNIPVVLCGGTGFYIQAALEDMSFPKGDANNPRRAYWEEFAQEYGSRALWGQLNIRDSKSAAVIHPNNTRRIVRALEMNAEGVSYAEQSANIKGLPEVIPSIRFAITMNRDTLYERINVRVDKMFEQGLVDEVSTLLQAGFRDALTAQQAIGYKEVVRYLDGTCSLDDAREDIKQATRRYAKRQLSWLKRDKLLTWLNADELTLEEMCSRILEKYSAAHLG